MGELALALALASVVCASVFLGLRRPSDYGRNPRLDRAWTSYDEALDRLRVSFERINGEPARHPVADLADFLDRRSDAPRG